MRDGRWRRRSRRTDPCADDRVRSPRTGLGRDARRILGGRAFVGGPNAAPPLDGDARARGTMADATGCCREIIGPALDPDRFESTIARDVRRDSRRCYRLFDVAKRFVSGTVFAPGLARALPSRVRTNVRWVGWIYGARLSRRPRLPANRGCRARSVRDRRMAPDNVLATALCAQANLAACAAAQFPSTRYSALNVHRLFPAQQGRRT